MYSFFCLPEMVESSGFSAVRAQVERIHPSAFSNLKQCLTVTCIFGMFYLVYDGNICEHVPLVVGVRRIFTLCPVFRIGLKRSCEVNCESLTVSFEKKCDSGLDSSSTESKPETCSRNLASSGLSLGLMDASSTGVKTLCRYSPKFFIFPDLEIMS